MNSRIINNNDTFASVHLLSFKNPEGCPLYEHIKNGLKTVEGRKNSEINQKIRPGDTILFSDKSKGILECEVTYINKYADVAEYLAGEGLGSALGNLAKCRNISTIAEGVELYREFVNDENILSLKEQFGHGFLGIGIKFIHEYKKYFKTLTEPWFSAMRDGLKIVEGRLNVSWISTLEPFDMIEFTKTIPTNGKKSYNAPKIEVLVTNIKKYDTFIDLFDQVGLDKLLPGVKTYEEALSIYRQWYSEEKEKQFGVVGIFIKVINKFN